MKRILYLLMATYMLIVGFTTSSCIDDEEDKTVDMSFIKKDYKAYECDSCFTIQITDIDDNFYYFRCIEGNITTKIFLHAATRNVFFKTDWTGSVLKKGDEVKVKATKYAYFVFPYKGFTTHEINACFELIPCEEQPNVR